MAHGTRSVAAKVARAPLRRHNAPAVPLYSYAVLGVALLSMGSSAPLIRLTPAPALSIALWRTALCWPVLALGALWRRERWPLGPGVLAGAFLAVHWISWVVAVQHTTVASASILIATGTLWSALLSGPLLRERVAPRQWLGLGLALAGVTLVATVKEAGRHTLFGDAMALVGSLAWVGYAFVGRRARQRAGFFGYTAAVYLVAGLLCLGAALATRSALTGFEPRIWASLGGMALFPTLLGHGGLNYLLREMGPARLSLWTLVEPVLATLAAWPLFGEVPAGQVALGGLATLGGVALGASAALTPAGARRDAAAGRAPP